MINQSLRYLFFGLLICFVSLTAFVCFESAVKSVKPLIYNEEALIEQLKGKPKEEVVKVLGMPAVKKPCQGCKEDLEFWWYSLPEAGIFVHFKDEKVTSISVITEDKRLKRI